MGPGAGAWRLAQINRYCFQTGADSFGGIVEQRGMQFHWQTRIGSGGAAYRWLGVMGQHCQERLRRVRIARHGGAHGGDWIAGQFR